MARIADLRGSWRGGVRVSVYPLGFWGIKKAEVPSVFSGEDMTSGVSVQPLGLLAGIIAPAVRRILTGRFRSWRNE